MMKSSILALLVHTFSICWSEVPYHGMKCDNGCGNSNNSTDKWCDTRRAGNGEEVWRCAELTRYGYLCVSSCDHVGESYTWCRTGHHSSDDWEYCSKQGVTIYGKKCLDKCRRKDDYWWCTVAGDSWDYCSPPSEVTPASYTINGQECIGECGQKGENYWWCSKSRRQKSSGRGNSPDASWDYCSPDSKHTRYNKRCTNGCAARGESYYWCNTGSSWDYCSPRMEVEYTYTRDGKLCVGKCHAGYCPAMGAYGKGYKAYRQCGDGVGTIRASVLLVLSIMYLVL